MNSIKFIHLLFGMVFFAIALGGIVHGAQCIDGKLPKCTNNRDVRCISVTVKGQRQDKVLNCAGQVQSFDCCAIGNVCRIKDGKASCFKPNPKGGNPFPFGSAKCVVGDAPTCDNGHDIRCTFNDFGGDRIQYGFLNCLVKGDAGCCPMGDKCGYYKGRARCLNFIKQQALGG